MWKPENSIISEILEEVNLEVEIIEPIHVWYYVKENFQLVGIDYFCIWRNGNLKHSDEHDAYEWLTMDEIFRNKL